MKGPAALRALSAGRRARRSQARNSVLGGSRWGWAAVVACCACEPGSPPPPAPARASEPTIPAEAPSKARAALPPPLVPGGKHVVAGAHGLVVAVEAEATRAGVRVLEAGGNAVDAAVAVAYALAVTHPSAGNLGGGGFMLVARRGGTSAAVDFRERAPLSLTPERFAEMLRAGARGPSSSAVPASVAGLNLAHRHFGRQPLADVLAPAIQLAERGHRVSERTALTLGWSWKKLRQDPEARRIFGTRRGPLRAGRLLRRPDLARTLRRIAEQGDRGFYAGETAAAIARATRGTRGKGSLTERDLRAYRAALRAPLRFRYRDYLVVTMPPPSSGGVAVALTLLALERHQAHLLPVNSARELHLFIEASKRAQALRRFELVDPDADPAMSADALWRGLLGRPLFGAVPLDPARATPSSRIHPAYERVLREAEHTTHLSVVDAEGMAVSCSVTLSSSFGAGYVVPGTGIVMNNALAAFGNVGRNRPAPGQRMLSSMTPTLLLSGDEVVAVLGSPGGDTIPSTVVQVLRHLVDHRWPLDVAIEAPRIHHGFVPDEVRFESSRPLPSGVLEELRRLGHALQPRRAPIGDANDIVVVEGVAYGHADSREGGLALAARPRAPRPTRAASTGRPGP